jgi:hypothetical protein
LDRCVFELDDNWSLNSGIRYLGYSPDDNDLDDCEVIIETMGLFGKF